MASGRIFNWEHISFRPGERSSIGELILNAILEKGSIEDMRAIVTWAWNVRERPELNASLREVNVAASRLIQSGHETEARAVLELATNLYRTEEDLTPSHLRLAYLYARAGEREKALEALGAALDATPASTYAAEIRRHLGGSEGTVPAP